MQFFDKIKMSVDYVELIKTVHYIHDFEEISESAYKNFTEKYSNLCQYEKILVMERMVDLLVFEEMGNRMKKFFGEYICIFNIISVKNVRGYDKFKYNAIKETEMGRYINYIISTISGDTDISLGYDSILDYANNCAHIKNNAKASIVYDIINAICRCMYAFAEDVNNEIVIKNSLDNMKIVTDYLRIISFSNWVRQRKIKKLFGVN